MRALLAAKVNSTEMSYAEIAQKRAYPDNEGAVQGWRKLGTVACSGRESPSLMDGLVLNTLGFGTVHVPSGRRVDQESQKGIQKSCWHLAA
jgi:hypothetical protein